MPSRWPDCGWSPATEVTQFCTELLLTGGGWSDETWHGVIGDAGGLYAACITETQLCGGETGRGDELALIVLAEGPRGMHHC